MFGYVTVNQKSMSEEDRDKYQAYYCGLCHALNERHGVTGQATLNYDMTFLYILLDSLYEPEETISKHRCMIHPMKSHTSIKSPIADYVADMTILLSYYKLKDDYSDDKSVVGAAGAALIKKSFLKVSQEYERQAKAVKEYIEELSKCEKANASDLDMVAGLTGKVMEDLFLYKQDEWEGTLREMAFNLGKYIYLADAYEDVEKDVKKKCYNVWRNEYEQPEFEDKCEKILNLLMGECAKAFEHLPIVSNTGILRNSIYSGVWLRYGLTRSRRDKRRSKR